MPRRLNVLLLLLVIVLAGCSDDEPQPTPRPTGPPPLSDAQQELARLSLLASQARYDVTYDFVAQPQNRRGALRIIALPPAYRVDITTGQNISAFILTPQRAVSCNISQRNRRSCLLVAGPGEPVPSLFDPGIQRLFSDAVADLAANPRAYDVETATPPQLPGGRPAGTCFRVARLAASPSPAPSGSATDSATSDASATASASTSATSGATATPAETPESGNPTGFEDGTYCFAANGVLTSLEITTGRLSLRRVGAVPTSRHFVPPAPVTRLPDLGTSSPTASPRAS